MANNFWTYTDYSAEKTTHAVTSLNLTAANFTAQEALRQAYFAANAALVNGILFRNGYGNVVIGSNLSDPEPVSQREMKWLVEYEGTLSGKRYQLEFGPARFDSAGFLVAGSDLANLTHATWVAFIAAFEGFVTAPDDPAEPVAILSIRLVGRNL